MMEVLIKHDVTIDVDDVDDDEDVVTSQEWPCNV